MTLNDSIGSDLTSILANAKNVVALFLRWWVGELSNLIPNVLRASLKGPQIQIESQSTSVTLRITHGGKQRILSSELHDVDRLRRDLVEFGKGRRTLQAAVILSADRYLCKTITLPLAARSRLKDAVRFQIKRISPFRETDVFYASSMVAPQAYSKDIQVAVALVLKREIEPLQKLAEDVGIEITRIMFAGSGSPKSSLSVDLPSARAKASSKTWDYALAFLIFVLSIITLGIMHNHAVALNEMIGTELKRLKPAAEKVVEIGKENASEADFAAQAMMSKTKNPNQLAILDALSGLLADDVRITEYRASGRIISFSGFALNATELLAKIDSAPHFSSAKFTAPVAREAALNLDRFSLSFELRGKP